MDNKNASQGHPLVGAWYLGVRTCKLGIYLKVTIFRSEDDLGDVYHSQIKVFHFKIINMQMSISRIIAFINLLDG